MDTSEGPMGVHLRQVSLLYNASFYMSNKLCKERGTAISHILVF